MSSKSNTTNNNTKETTSTSTAAAADALYTFDPYKLDQFRRQAPWTKHPKWFNNVALSPSAVMKMMTHCHSGVQKGRAKGSNPIEVMGLLLGRPSPETPKTLIVTDVFPLPIEGFETRVIADDQDVINHMISLGECLERTRKEKFMGWYHSHPFDYVEHLDYGHCFLSQTDISTQLQWQRMEDPHGNPFLAIVVDPIRSLVKGMPELKAFRAYPPEYNSSTPNQCPDGTVIRDERERLERWGSCWSRYYELSVEYFISAKSRAILEILTKSFRWISVLGGGAAAAGGGASAGSTRNSASSMEPKGKYSQRVTGVADKMEKLDLATLITGGGNIIRPGTTSASAVGSMVIGTAARDASGIDTGTSSSSSSLAPPGSASGAASGNESRGTSGPGNEGTHAATAKNADAEYCLDSVVELATEKIQANIVQVVKKELFS